MSLKWTMKTITCILSIPLGLKSLKLCHWFKEARDEKCLLISVPSTIYMIISHVFVVFMCEIVKDSHVLRMMHDVKS